MLPYRPRTRAVSFFPQVIQVPRERLSNEFIVTTYECYYDGMEIVFSDEEWIIFFFFVKLKSKKITNTRRKLIQVIVQPNNLITIIIIITTRSEKFSNLI